MAEAVAPTSAIASADNHSGLRRAQTAARVAAENRGRDVVILDLRELTCIFDFFVLVSGASRRQLHAISEEIDRVLQNELGDRRLGIEGYEESRWILLDYGDVVIHMFEPDTRAYYAIEELWAQAKRVPVEEAERTTEKCRTEARRPEASILVRLSRSSIPHFSVIIFLSFNLFVRAHMSLLSHLQSRFRPVLAALVDSPEPWLEMIRRAQEVRFGDYQANFAMALGKQLNKKPQDLAADVVARLDVADLCEPPQVAGPGFINLRLKDEWLVEQLTAAVDDPRLGVEPVAQPRTYVIDYSGPNVAKPMHVGHIRSTVIGDALCRTLRFLGHTVISDNHIGDWGTQFGMIIYGYKHFLEPDGYRSRPVQELARLYRLVRQLVDYYEAKKDLPKPAAWRLDGEGAGLGRTARGRRAGARPEGRQEASRGGAEVGKLGEGSDRGGREAAERKIAAVDSDPMLAQLAAMHPQIGRADPGRDGQAPCRRCREPPPLAGVHALLPGRHPADLPPPERRFR